MAEQKTKQTELSVDVYIDAIDDETRRKDCRTLIELMSKAAKAPPKMWGTGIVGFGSYHYKYASGHEGDSCLTGFASRKKDLTLYILAGFDEYDGLLEKIGKHRRGKGCLYLKNLADVDLKALARLVSSSVQRVKKRYA